MLDATHKTHPLRLDADLLSPLSTGSVCHHSHQLCFPFSKEVIEQQGADGVKHHGEEVERVAELARLRLSTGEKEKYGEQLSAILGYFHMLEGLETTNVSPTSHCLMLENVLREDVVQDSLPVEKVLSMAPQLAGQLISIPRTES